MLQQQQRELRHEDPAMWTRQSPSVCSACRGEPIRTSPGQLKWPRRRAWHPAAVTVPLALAWFRACLSARRPALHARRVLVFTRRDRSIVFAASSHPSGDLGRGWHDSGADRRAIVPKMGRPFCPRGPDPPRDRSKSARPAVLLRTPRAGSQKIPEQPKRPLILP